jgi:hypothetical protein
VLWEVPRASTVGISCAVNCIPVETSCITEQSDQTPGSVVVMRLNIMRIPYAAVLQVLGCDRQSRFVAHVVTQLAVQRFPNVCDIQRGWTVDLFCENKPEGAAWLCTTLKRAGQNTAETNANTVQPSIE